jgi:hypothetical protein
MSIPPPTYRVVLRGIMWTLLGALIAAALGLLAFIPGELMMTAGSAEGSHVDWTLAAGVAVVCARAGAVAGLIAFFLKRSLTGETADPMERASRPGDAPRPPRDPGLPTPDGHRP